MAILGVVECQFAVFAVGVLLVVDLLAEGVVVGDD
jgi:hypothetical protein